MIFHALQPFWTPHERKSMKSHDLTNLGRFLRRSARNQHKGGVTRPFWGITRPNTIHAHPSTSIHIHPHPSTFIHIHPHPSTSIRRWKIYENLRKSTKIYENQRKSTKIYEDLRKSTKIIENTNFVKFDADDTILSRMT